MRLSPEIILFFGAGLMLLMLIGRLLIVPMRFLWRVVAGGVLGALVILLVNLLGGPAGLHIAMNPFTALTIGFLGLPGAALVMALAYFL